MTDQQPLFELPDEIRSRWDDINPHTRAMTRVLARLSGVDLSLRADTKDGYSHWDANVNGHDVVLTMSRVMVRTPQGRRAETYRPPVQVTLDGAEYPHQFVSLSEALANLKDATSRLFNS